MAKHIITSDTAPGSAPTELGQHYVDTTAGKVYLSFGTSSVGDWQEVGAGGGSGSGDLVAVAVTGDTSTYYWDDSAAQVLWFTTSNNAETIVLQHTGLTQPGSRRVLLIFTASVTGTFTLQSTGKNGPATITYDDIVGGDASSSGFDSRSLSITSGKKYMYEINFTSFSGGDEVSNIRKVAEW